ncbi:hypothetical protein LJC55_03055 [Eubacteriales bacterium OttesenSCG-928-N14]|nr:hypothetical protein [Eubacteriales bacterium OttesenSCG-928-N14]
MKTWIIDNLTAALTTWNDKIKEVWALLTQDPAAFRGGVVWSVVLAINQALQAIGLGLLVIFFTIGIIKEYGSFVETKRPEVAVKLFIRFILSKWAITYGIELMRGVLSIAQGITSRIMTASGFGGATDLILPPELVSAISKLGWLDSFVIGILTLIAGLVITVLSFLVIMQVYSRFFKLFLYISFAPIPLSAFAGSATSSIGWSFCKGFLAVALEAAVIVIACVLFGALAASPPVLDPAASASSMVWSYTLSLAFDMVLLVGCVKLSDRLTKELMGLF